MSYITKYISKYKWIYPYIKITSVKPDQSEQPGCEVSCPLVDDYNDDDDDNDDDDEDDDDDDNDDDDDEPVGLGRCVRLPSPGRQGWSAPW